MNRIDLVPWGWAQESWVGGFYPADLPEEWRLCYFSNEFPSVLLPRVVWTGAADDLVAEWVADLPAEFCVYLEGACVGDRAKLRRVLSVLGGLVVGIVDTGRAIEQPGCVSFSFCKGPIEAVRRAGPVACSIPGALVDDLPAARRLLEALAARPDSAPAVVIVDPVSVGALHRWWQLAHMAGLA